MKFSEFLTGRSVLENGHRDLNPRVTVAMPTFCRHAEGRLMHCIDSVLAQTLSDFEFIILDDGSVDGTESAVRDRALRDPRIVYIRYAENSGLPAVRQNEGILLARAPYIAFMFDDNVWKPDALESLCDGMEADPVDVVYANVEMVRDAGGPEVLGPWPLTLELLPHINTIPNGGVLCRRQFFDVYGLYDPHLVLRRLCDFDLWLRALRLGATFRHLDRCIGTEYGHVSPVSLGRSVQWDFKVAYAYLACEQRLAQRVAALQPERIRDYDVFDAQVLLPYLRGADDWSVLEQR
ncbi:MAG TPA: glycosyltransferase family A protein, partial [Candidatus Kryptonia bacterium]|nr:glycosyltransferase family A protein [Candidatus Kryptonia bacterium]